MRLLLIVGFLVVAYMLYKLTVSIYENYQIEKHIQEFEAKNAELQAENEAKLADFQYYTSEEYVEKVAKQNLGLINPGEQVLVIPDEDLIVLSQNEEEQRVAEEIRASWSSPKKWWKFFFSSNPFKA
ncbi:MAG: septum formation initiator family protein [Candidatus Gracilibacteria bacterium]